MRPCRSITCASQQYRRSGSCLPQPLSLIHIFNYALCVGVTAPFYLTKRFAPYFAPGASVINISSSRDRMSQPQTESYTAAKGGISALTHALAVSLAGKVRVNSISPGWIDTDFTIYDGSDATQHRCV